VALETDLHRIAEREFRDLLELNYTSHAWFIAWRKLLPAYVDWQLARSASGWRWQDGEVRCERKLPRPDGGTLTLRGTLDRLDIADGKLAVLDYKTRAPDALRKTLKARGEDVQLPVYALLAEEKGQVVEAAYVSLHGTKPCIVPLAEDPLQLGREIAERLVELFALFEAGTPALANGIEEACRYCEMRGLCRRGHWTDTP
jgi:ATP-dependent helicase/nuclease subunit B